MSLAVHACACIALYFRSSYFGIIQGSSANVNLNINAVKSNSVLSPVYKADFLHFPATQKCCLLQKLKSTQKSYTIKRFTISGNQGTINGTYGNLAVCDDINRSINHCGNIDRYIPGSFTNDEDLESQDDGDVDGGEDEHGKNPAFAFENSSEDKNDVILSCCLVSAGCRVNAVRIVPKHAHL